MVAINVLELHVHKRVELHRHEARPGTRTRVLHALEPQEPASVSDNLIVRRDDKSQPATDRGGVQIADGEREECGEGSRKRSGGLLKEDGLRVQHSVGAGVGDGKVVSETHTAIIQVGVAKELEAAEGDEDKIYLWRGRERKKAEKINTKREINLKKKKRKK